MFALLNFAVVPVEGGGALYFGSMNPVQLYDRDLKYTPRPLALPGWSGWVSSEETEERDEPEAMYESFRRELETYRQSRVGWVPRPAGPRGAILLMSCGVQHFAAVTTEGMLWVGGSNAEGQLGFPICDWKRGNSFPDPRIVEDHYVLRPHPLTAVDMKLPNMTHSKVRCESVACGADHTLLVLRLDVKPHPSVWACGCNSNCQLGFLQDQYSDQRYHPFTEVDTSMLGGEAHTHIKQIRIAAGSEFSVVAIDNNVGVTTGLFGEWTYPWLGNNGVIFAGMFDEMAHPPLGDIPARDGKLQALPEQPWQVAGEEIKHLVAGLHHVLVGALKVVSPAPACALKVYSWGDNEWGQLGLPGQFEPILTPTELDFDFGTFEDKGFSSLLAANMHTSCVMVGGKLWQFGSLHHGGQASRPEIMPSLGDEDVAFVSVGNDATAVTTTSGKLYMSGAPWRDDLRENRNFPADVARIGLDFRMLPAAVPAFGAVGDWALGLERKLAFAMGAHLRLCRGPANVPPYVLELDDALLCLILETLQKTMVCESPMLLSAGVFLA